MCGILHFGLWSGFPLSASPGLLPHPDNGAAKLTETVVLAQNA